MDLAVKIVGGVIASALSSGAGYLLVNDGRGAAPQRPVATQFRSVQSALYQRPDVRGVQRYKRRVARQRARARSNYQRWSKSRYFKVRQVRVRIRTVRIRRR